MAETNINKALFVKIKNDFGVLRTEENTFYVIDCDGGLYKFDLEGLRIFLEAHGRKRDDLETLLTFEEKEFFDYLVSKRILKYTEEKPSPFFNPEPILKNARKNFEGREMLSLITLELSLTNECPYSCKWCYKTAKPPSEGVSIIDEVGVKKLQKTLKDASSLGCKKLVLTGGEPSLVIDDVIKIVRMAKKEGIDEITMLTAGYNLRDYILELNNAGITRFQVTLNSSKEKTHDRYLGRAGAYKMAIDTIRTCVENGIPLTVSSVIPFLSKIEMENIILLCIDLGVKVVGLSVIEPFGKGKLYEMPYSDFKSFKMCIKDLREKYGNNIKILFKYRLTSTTPSVMVCPAGVSGAYISEDGDVFSCAFFEEFKNFCIGNINQTSFSELWRFSKTLEAFRKVDIVKASCKDCAIWDLCIGNCRAKSFLRSGDINISKGRCPYGSKNYSRSG